MTKNKARQVIEEKQERATKSEVTLDSEVTLFYGTQQTKSVTKVICCQWSPLSEPQYTEKKKLISTYKKKWTQGRKLKTE